LTGTKIFIVKSLIFNFRFKYKPVTLFNAENSHLA